MRLGVRFRTIGTSNAPKEKVSGGASQNAGDVLGLLLGDSPMNLPNPRFQWEV